METVRYDVTTSSRQINIRPVGDLQMAETSGFRRDLWDKWKREALGDKTSLIIGMGDYSDRFRTTVDKKLLSTLVQDGSAWAELDELLMKEMQGLADELKPFRNRIIGLHCGHHHHRLVSGTCTCQYLCQLLKVRHLGFVSMIQLAIHRSGNSTHVIDIFSTHGCGGAQNVASDLTNLERKIMPFWDADPFLRGHSTRAYVAEGNPLSYLSKANKLNEHPRIKRKKRILVNTGGFQEGYIEGTQSYVEKANMPPVSLGWCVVNLHIPSGGDEVVKINAQAYTD